MGCFGTSSQNGRAWALSVLDREAVGAVVLRCAGRVLRWRYMPIVLALVAVIVSLPAVGTGFLNDDYMHRAILIGPTDYVSRLSEVGLAPDDSGRLGTILSDLYIAVHPAKNLESLKAYGSLPWWTYEGYRVAFWRPVAALTYWLDYRLFPNSTALMHVHSILWFGAVVFVLAILYRRFIGTAWIASLAALLFLLDDGSFFPTMWLANRNLPICLLFSLLTLIVYDRWRREQWRPGFFLTPLCLLLSVLSAEAGVTTCAYLFAYEVSLTHDRWIKRALALVPSAIVIVGWRLYYNLQDYGAAGGGFYFDPLSEPLGFLAAIVRRAPFLLAGQWTTIPPELHSFLPPMNVLLLWFVLVGLTVLIPIVMWPFIRSHIRSRFWLIGMYLSVIPFCATVPMSRSLVFIAVGAFGLIAEFIAGWLTDRSWLPKASWKCGTIRNLVIIFILAHGPLALAGRITASHVMAEMEKKMAKTMNLGALEGIQDQDLVVVNAPNPALFLYEPYQRAYENEPLPKGMRILAPGFDAVQVTRTGDRQLVIASPSGSLFDCQKDNARSDLVYFYRYLSDVRGPGYPLRRGQRIILPGVTVEILALDERSYPRQLAFDFDRPLEDPSLRWLWWDWDKHRYKSFEVPAIGQTVHLVGPF